MVMLGASIGSFLSVVIPRLKYREKGIVTGRSKCQHCKNTLSAKELIPLVSYIFLQGKCRYCKAKIGLWYPMIELFTAASFLLVFSKWNPLESNPEMSPLILWLTFLLFLIYATILIGTFFYDLKYMEVPDALLVPGIILALTATILPTTPVLIDALIGSLIPLGFFGLQIIISKGKWMGLGDLRIGVFMGLILGWESVIVALILSYLIGAIVSSYILLSQKGTLKTRIPFAPFLVIGTFISIFLGKNLIDWYLKIIHFS